MELEVNIEQRVKYRKLQEQIEKLFETGIVSSSDKHIDSGYGNVETRSCDIITDLRFLDVKEDWMNLNSVIRMKSERHNKSTNFLFHPYLL